MAKRRELLAVQAQRQTAVAQKQTVELDIDWDAEALEMKMATRKALEATLQDAYEAVRGRYAGMNISVSWEVWDRAAAALAQKYDYELIPNLNNSTKEQLGRAISEWIEKGAEFPDLVKKLQHIIPPGPIPGKVDRARVIAATEVTRIFAESRVAGMQAAGLKRMRWRTAEDELVCPICAPLGAADDGRGAIGSVTEKRFVNPGDGKTYGPPPAHVHCRCWIVEDTDELNQLLEGQRLPEPEPEVTVQEPEPEGGRFPYRLEELREVRGMHLSGAHRKTVYAAPDGSKWLFKPQDEFRAYGDKVAYDLAKALGHPAAETYVVEINGQIGSIQRMFDNVERSLANVDPASLNREQIIQIQKEHIFDWLIGNHDGHAENLLLLEDGRIVGIDKGQLFRFYDQDRLDWEYNPNKGFGVVSYHNQILRRWAAGEDVAYFNPLETDALREFIKRIQALDDETLKQIVRPYAERAAQFRVGRGRVALAYQDVDRFLEAVVERKNRIADDFRELYERALKARNRVLGVAEALTPVTEKLTRDIVSSGWQGKTILLADEGIDNMTALAYKVDGDGTILEMKLLEDGDRRFMGVLRELSEEAALQAGDPYWDDVLKAAKSYNYHLKPDSPGYDGEVPLHTKQLIHELYRKLGDAAASGDPAAEYYLDYITKLVREISGIDELGGMVGKTVEPYKPKAPPRRRRKPYRTSATPASTPKVRNRQGRIELAEGEVTFTGRGFQIDFGSGIRASYIPYDHENRYIYSKQGRLLVQIDGDPTPEKINRALDHLHEFGLNVRPATKEDIEYLYLKKMAWLHKLDDEAFGITSNMTRRQKIEAYKRYWAQRLGVDDVTDLPGYNPMPTYDPPSVALKRKRGQFGRPRWFRFDITEKDLNREMRGYALAHSITSGNLPSVLEAMLDHNGGLVATEEKYRIGVPIGGMSPVQDQQTGGAQFVFTRIVSPRGVKSYRYQLVFDKRLLLDVDAISYDRDLYGDVRPNVLQKERHITIAEWKECARRRDNETIFKRYLPLDYLIRINARSEIEREDIIEMFRSRGITKLGGKRIEDLVQVGL